MVRPWRERMYAGSVASALGGKAVESHYLGKALSKDQRRPTQQILLFLRKNHPLDFAYLIRDGFSDPQRSFKLQKGIQLWLRIAEASHERCSSPFFALTTLAARAERSGRPLCSAHDGGRL